jgi:hypothetical protein
MDWSQAWHPESKIILDIPTALNFFLENKIVTKRKIGEMARHLVSAWNAMYAGTKNVIL